MRWLIITSVLMLPGVSEAAVTFSEVAWMGTENSANDEWIELYNDDASVDVTGWVISDGMNLEIELAGVLGAGQYAVLERTDDDSAPGTAFLIYTGSLTNSGATLTLRDATGNIQDQVAGGENWENIGGDNATKETAQYSSGGWVTAVATPGNINASEDSVTEEAEPVDDTTAVSESKSQSSNTKSTKSTKTTKLELKDSILTLKLTAPERAYVNQEVVFTIEPSGISQRLMPSITYNWNFGDFRTAAGKDVQHVYQYPGTYVVFVDAGYARHDASIRHEITVLPVNFSITRTRSGDIQINNDAKYEIDLSNYQIQAREMLRIPENTILLPGATITIAKELVSAGESDLIVLSDTMGVMLATHGRRVSEPLIAVKPAVSLEEITATPSVQNEQWALPTTNFTFKEPIVVEETPEIIDSTSNSQVATSTQAAQLHQGAAGSIPKDSMAYFGLAGILALGFLGVFAGRIGTG